MKQCFRATRRLFSIVLLCCGFVGVTSCVKLSQPVTALKGQNASQSATTEISSAPRLDINTVTPEQLEKLPGIGRTLAARIVEHRERYGRFRRAEHLIIVRGISDRRFRLIRELITVE